MVQHKWKYLNKNAIFREIIFKVIILISPSAIDGLHFDDLDLFKVICQGHLQFIENKRKIEQLGTIESSAPRLYAVYLSHRKYDYTLMKLKEMKHEIEGNKQSFSVNYSQYR